MKNYIPEQLEQWSRKYLPMLHDREQNRRFYYCHGDRGFRDILQHVMPEHSPFVMIDSEVFKTVSPRFTTSHYHLYFVVRCEDMVDDRSLYQANIESSVHAERFYNYLLRHSDGMMRRLIDFDDVSIQSYNIGFDGWTSSIMSISIKESTDLCTDEGLYTE